LLIQNAFAAHPLLTEDTATQGVGNAELEHGLSWMRDGDEHVFAFQPQLSIGLQPTLDLLLQPSWVIDRSTGTPATRGFGDTVLDAKWRFYGFAPLSLAVRAGFQLPTSQGGLGLPHGRTSEHALLVATVDAVPWTLHANLGMTRNPALPGLRRNVGHASAAALWSLDERWILTLDAGFDSNPDPARSSWPGVVLGGVIFTVRPGFDIDVGWQTSLRQSASTRQWLLGLTYRFSL
jgi:hypothetical protein